MISAAVNLRPPAQQKSVTYGVNVAWARSGLAHALLMAGRSSEAPEQIHEILSGQPYGAVRPMRVAWALVLRGFAEREQGHPERAEETAHEALTTALPDLAWAGTPALLLMARVAADLKSHEEAARLLGAARPHRARGSAR